MQALHTAADLRIGSPDVRTETEREQSVVADRQADILRVFGFDGGDAVLVFGVLDGSLVRYLAESVRSVVCVAGGPDVGLVQARCRGLSNVSVVESLAAVAHRDCFDAVVSLAAPIDAATFDSLQPLIGDTTMVVWGETPTVAIDDLFDHSPDAVGATERLAVDRTGGRRDRHERMTRAGLRMRATLYPYPAIESPSLLLASPFFRDRNPIELLDRASSRRAAFQPTDWSDEASAIDRLRLLLRADAARPLMPAQIVVASKQAIAVDRLDCSVAAWAFSHAGRTAHSAMETLSRTSDGSVASTTVSLFDAEASTNHLTFAPAPDSSLGDEVMRACVAQDIEQLTTSLKRWRSAVSELEHPGTGGVASQSVVPGRWFDVRISNVACSADALDESPSDDQDGLRLLSDAFRVSDPVPVDTVIVRSLWYLARHIVGLGVPHPWSPTISTDELALKLSVLSGDNFDAAAIEGWRGFEADVLAAVWDDDRSGHLARLVAAGAATGVQIADAQVSDVQLADVQLADVQVADVQLADVQAELVSLQATALGYEHRIADLQRQLGEATAGVPEDIDELRLQLADAERLLDRQNDKIDAQSRLMTEVIRKYERAVHERNMVEQGMQSYRRAVTVAKKVMPTEMYFKIRKLIRGH